MILEQKKLQWSEENLPAVVESKKQELAMLLEEAAIKVTIACKTHLSAGAADIDELKELARIIRDIRAAFFDNKEVQVQNNTQINISDSRLNFFQGAVNGH